MDELAPAPTWSTIPTGSTAPGWRTVAAGRDSKPQWVLRDVAPSAPGEAKPTPGLATDPASVTVATLSGRPTVMGMSNAISVNRVLYPDASITVPNGFKRDPQHFFSIGVNGVNQERKVSCNIESCLNGELFAEMALLQSGAASLEMLYNAESGIYNRFGYQSLGFRLALNVLPNLGIAFGGNSVAYLDTSNPCSIYDTCAPFKGRSLFAVASSSFPLNSNPEPPVVTLTAGAGNGYYGYNGSSDDKQWGPIGSASLAFNKHISIGVEYTGYVISAGVSLKPFTNIPLVTSVYAQDFLGHFPDYIKTNCYGGNESCGTRFFGRLTYSY